MIEPISVMEGSIIFSMKKQTSLFCFKCIFHYLCKN